MRCSDSSCERRDGMKKRMLPLLLALSCLAACAAPAEDGMEEALAPEEPARQEESVLQESPADAELCKIEWKPYEAWTFVPEPFLVTTEEYGALFAPKELVYDDTARLLGYRLPESANPCGAYGVPALFPFTHWEEIGICEGLKTAWKDDTLWCDEAYAIARRYYSLALEFSSPDGTAYIAQESNYPQLLSAMIWRLFGFDRPSEVTPYTAPIQIQAAEMNSVMDGWISGTEWNLDAFCALSLSEQVAKQNERLNVGSVYADVCPPESNRYYAITGLTILNGDNRTEETYFAGGRARDIRITVNGEYTREITLKDSPAPQLISLDYTQHTIAKPLDITIEVLSGYPGNTPDIYIAEIGVGIDSNLPQGR